MAFIKQAEEEDPLNQKQSIFGADGAPLQQNLTGQEQAPGQQSIKKGGSQVIGGAGSGQGVQGVAAVQAPRGASEQRQKAFEIAAERVPIPAGLKSLEAGLAQKEGALDTGEDQYLQTYKQTDFGLDPSTIEQATLGQQASFDKLSGLLTQETPGYLPETFEAGRTDTPGIQDIQTEGGLAEYLKRQGGSQYSAGEGDYDVARLTANPQFQAARLNLGRREDVLTDRAAELERTLPGQAEDILLENLQKAQGGARGGLSGLQQDLRGTLQGRKEDLLAQLAELRAQTPELAEEQAILAREELAKRIPDERGLDDYILGNELGIDPSKYFNVGIGGPIRAQSLDPSSFANALDAAQWNRIQGLLGTGGTAMEAGGEFGDLTRFHAQPYQQALERAAREAYEAANTEPTDFTEQIKKAAKKNQEREIEKTIEGAQQLPGDTEGLLEEADEEILATDPGGLGTSVVAGKQAPTATVPGAIDELVKAGKLDEAAAIAGATAGAGGTGGFMQGVNQKVEPDPIESTDPTTSAAANTATQMLPPTSTGGNTYDALTEHLNRLAAEEEARKLAPVTIGAGGSRYG